MRIEEDWKRREQKRRGREEDWKRWWARKIKEERQEYKKR